MGNVFFMAFDSNKNSIYTSIILYRQLNKQQFLHIFNETYTGCQHEQYNGNNTVLNVVLRFPCPV